jgi:hypothetical protein
MNFNLWENLIFPWITDIFNIKKVQLVNKQWNSSFKIIFNKILKDKKIKLIGNNVYGYNEHLFKYDNEPKNILTSLDKLNIILSIINNWEETNFLKYRLKNETEKYSFILEYSHNRLGTPLISISLTMQKDKNYIEIISYIYNKYTKYIIRI